MTYQPYTLTQNIPVLALSVVCMTCVFLYVYVYMSAYMLVSQTFRDRVASIQLIYWLELI